MSAGPFPRIVRIVEAFKLFYVSHSPMSANKSKTPRSDLEDAVLAVMAEQEEHDRALIVAFIRNKASKMRTINARTYLDSIATAIADREYLG